MSVTSSADAEKRLWILITPGVVSVVGNGKSPAIVDDAEIEAIRNAIRNKLHIEPWDLLERGDPVEVVRGPLAGVEGTFLRYKGAGRLVLAVTIIGRAVAAEMDSSCVRAARPRFRPAHPDAAGQRRCV